MRHVDKKLIGITAIGLSAWILVIALVIINKSTTTAMFTSNPAPVQQTAPQTLGITTLAHGEHHVPAAAPTATNTRTPSVLPVILIVGSALVAASAIVATLAIRKRSAKN